MKIILQMENMKNVENKNLKMGNYAKECLKIIYMNKKEVEYILTFKKMRETFMKDYLIEKE